jgi:hypothetical protein
MSQPETLLQAALRTSKQCSPLLALLVEVRNLIYADLVPSNRVIDVTIPHPRHRVFRNWFRHFVPDMKSIPIMQACAIVEEECIELMYSANTFFTKNGDTIRGLPDVLSKRNGPDAIGRIRQFEFVSHFLMKAYPNKFIPAPLEVVVMRMTNLERMQISSSFAKGSVRLPETDGGTRVGQEKRVLIRFGAFITVGIPSWL